MSVCKIKSGPSWRKSERLLSSRVKADHSEGQLRGLDPIAKKDRHIAHFMAKPWQLSKDKSKYAHPFNYIIDVRAHHKFFNIDMLKRYYAKKDDHVKETLTGVERCRKSENSGYGI